MFRFFIPILLIHQLLIIFIHSVLYPIHYASKNLFFLEITGGKFDITYETLFLLDAVNLILLWLISKLIFKNKFSITAPLIYAIIPWSSYLVSAGSFYIYLLLILLITVYGLLKTGSNKKLGYPLLIGGIIIGIYSSALLLILLPLLLFLLSILKLISIKDLKPLVAILFLSTVPLLFLIYSNMLGFKNIINNEIKIFEDPGLLNMVNSFQGAANQQGFGQLAKLSENKYLFFSEYILLKVTKQFVPSAIFTPQEKLLNFSFSPPIYLGFLIPFVFGFCQMLKTSRLRKALFLSTLLIIPSVLAKSIVDLNRLFILMPVIVLVITFGLVLLYEQRNKKKIAIFLAITILLVIFQIIVTISDIQIREKDRFIRYYGQNYEIGKQ